LWVYGALVAGSVRLPAVAAALLLQGVTDARLPSSERRLGRWLANPRLDVERIWQACGPARVQAWRGAGHPARLVLDATPLADRGLVGHPLVALCQQQGWHSVLRLAGPQCCPPQPAADAQTGWVRLDTLVAPGQDWYGPVRLWKKTAPRRGLLTVYWDPAAAQPWCCFSDQSAQDRRLAESADRVAVEATFQEAKSRGWQLEDVPLVARNRLKRLQLVLALTRWLARHYAASCLHHGQRAHLDRHDRHDRRDNGLLRLGRLWFCRCLGRLPLGRLHRCLPFHQTPAGWCLPLRF
jgi:hypothetical protein